MRYFLKSVTKKTGYMIAVGIIVAALFVSASRLLTPLLNEHRLDFEKWASMLLDMPVSINQVRVSWYKYHPVISLSAVTIYSKETKEPILQIQEVDVFISPLQSLWQRLIVTNGVMISGTDVNVYRTKTGDISIQGFPVGSDQKPFNQETKFQDILGWLSQQSHLLLRQVNVSYNDFTRQKRFITLYELNLENTKNKHLVFGKAILHQDIPTEVTIALQWFGNSTNLADIKANIYLYLSGFSLTQWLKDYSWQGWQIKQGVVSAKIWAMWELGKFAKIQSTFQSYGLNLFSNHDQSMHMINRLSGNIGWKQKDQEQIFAGDDILIDFPSHLWPVTSFYVSMQPDANGDLKPRTAFIGYADLKDAQNFLFSSPAWIDDSLQKIVKNLALIGRLQNVSLTFQEPWTDWQRTSFDATFNQVYFTQTAHWPGVKNLSGRIKWDGSKGRISLQSNHAALIFDDVFINPIAMDQLSGDINVQYDANQSWLIDTPGLNVLNGDGAANTQGSLLFPKDKSPISDLIGNFTLHKASRVTRYLPLKIFSSDLATWLKQAFVSGDMQSGKIILRGSLDEFPFDQNNGTFFISGKVRHIDFHYAPDWPNMRDVNGEIIFAGRQVNINAERASIFGISVTNIQGNIPYLGEDQPQILQIKSDRIQADFVKALGFIHASPLEKTLGKLFSDVEMAGPLELNLGLTIPLAKPEDTRVLGEIFIKNASMQFIPWHLNLHHLNGQIKFTENSTTAQDIQGEIFNQPITFNLTTEMKAKEPSLVKADFNTYINVKDLERWLDVPFTKVVTGSTSLKGQIDFSLVAPILVHLNSNLVGIKVNLQDKYAKDSQEARNFSTDIQAQKGMPLRIKLSYGDLFSSAFILKHEYEKFNLISVNLRLGGGDPSWPPLPGLYISGRINELNVDDIKQYTKQDSNFQFAGLKLRGIDVETNLLTVMGQSLTNVRLQAAFNKKIWSLTINSEQVIGKIDMPANFSQTGTIDAEFQKLNLVSSKNKQTNTIDLKSLPPISFLVHEFSYNKMPIGRVNFKTIPSGDGLVIQNLNMLSPYLDLKASGIYTKAHGTHLQGRADSTEVSGLLNSFGLDVHNFIASKGSLDFDLNWNGVPHVPSFESLNGKAIIKLGAGRIVDVGQTNDAKMGIGRMLSIFSLQTIPRRLTFDFSDIFQKGYSFDSMKGEFDLKNGNAYTTDLRFDGPVARLGIDGRIGLKNQDYDFTLSVTPYVTTGISLAATVLSAGNPIVSLAAMAINSVIGPAVSKIATYYYEVKGPWDNPTWESIKVNKPR